MSSFTPWLGRLIFAALKSVLVSFWAFGRRLPTYNVTGALLIQPHMSYSAVGAIALRAAA